jgi:hypothetical protein
MTALKIRFEPGFRKLRDMAQYVTTVTDPTAAETYGARYVFEPSTRTRSRSIPDSTGRSPPS